MVKRTALAIALTMAFALAALQLSAQSVILNNNGKKPTVAIKNAMIVPVTAPVCNNCTIVFTAGKITAIGADAAIPCGAMVIDGTGLRVYPGMIDSGTRIGLTRSSPSLARTTSARSAT